MSRQIKIIIATTGNKKKPGRLSGAVSMVGMVNDEELGGEEDKGGRRAIMLQIYYNKNPIPSPSVPDPFPFPYWNGASPYTPHHGRHCVIWLD